MRKFTYSFICFGLLLFIIISFQLQNPKSNNNQKFIINMNNQIINYDDDITIFEERIIETNNIYLTLMFNYENINCDSHFDLKNDENLNVFNESVYLSHISEEQDYYYNQNSSIFEELGFDHYYDLSISSHSPFVSLFYKIEYFGYIIDFVTNIENLNIISHIELSDESVYSDFYSAVNTSNYNASYPMANAKTDTGIDNSVYLAAEKQLSIQNNSIGNLR